jgi:ketosteroid isomerase-like protein
MAACNQDAVYTDQQGDCWSRRMRGRRMKIGSNWVAGANLGAVLAFAPPAIADGSVTALLRHQTDAFSEASDRRDQPRMDALLDDEVLFSGGNGTVDRDPQRDKNDMTALVLKRQAQSFRGAGQRGAVSAMRRYLDDQVLFVNEDGAVSGNRDFKTGAPAAPPRPGSSTLTLSDWVLHYSGDVAVASYTDHQTVRFGDQILSYQFLSVDSWVKRRSGWKLIGSETIPLNQDPPAMTPAPQELADYAGNYVAGQLLRVTIALDGNALALSTNGGSPAVLVPISRDEFISGGAAPGYARAPIIFQRDAQGHISGYVSRNVILSRRESATGGAIAPAQNPTSTLALKDFVVHQTGDIAVATFLHERTIDYGGVVMHKSYRSIETWIKRANGWKMIASQGRELLADPPSISLSPSELQSYSGGYSAGLGLRVQISPTADALAASTNGERPIRLVPQVRDVFFVPGSPRITVIFQRDSAGRITGYISRRDGRDLAFSRG